MSPSQILCHSQRSAAVNRCTEPYRLTRASIVFASPLASASSMPCLDVMPSRFLRTCPFEPGSNCASGRPDASYRSSVTTGDRYDASGLPEAQFEPGSNGQVLKNRLGITSKQGMDDAEARGLAKTMDALVRRYGSVQRFTAADLCEWHRIWLGDIYEWAGRYRQVNVS